MAFHKILVPVDFSPCSREAYEVAVSLARQMGGELLVLHVVNSRDLEQLAELGSLDGEKLEKALHKRARYQLGDFLSSHPREVRMHRVVIKGVPFNEIVKMSRREGVDLIVMGRSGGTGELDKIFFGSTAEKVVRVAPCAVLSIPVPTRASRSPSS
jgi:nucleotide-binding universal stress UspA family protein